MDAKRVLFEKDLPVELRHLVDSTKPLPTDVQFFEGPPATKRGAAVWVGLAVVSTILSVAMFIFSAKTRSGAYESGANALSIQLFSGGVICALLTVGWIYKARLDYKRAKATDQGVADRQGLFLTPDALLIWSDLSRLFPRDKVISFTTDPINKDGIVFLRSNLKFKNASGAEEDIPHIEDCLEGEKRSVAAKAIEAWAQ